MLQGIPGGLPAPGRRQRRQRAAGRQEFFAIALIEVAALGGQRRPPQGRHVVEAFPADHRQQLGGIGRVVEVAAAMLPNAPVLLQPGRRIGVALELFIGLSTRAARALSSRPAPRVSASRRRPRPGHRKTGPAPGPAPAGAGAWHRFHPAPENPASGYTAPPP